MINCLKLIFYLLLFFSIQTKAQETIEQVSKTQETKVLFDSLKFMNNSFSSYGFGSGTAHYFGDLSPISTFYYGLKTNVRWNFAVNYTFHFNKKYALISSFSYIRLFGDDAIYAANNINDPNLALNYLRNLSFRNDVKELNFMLIRNLRVPKIEGFKNRLKFTPYFGIGLGLIAHDPMTRANKDYENHKGVWVKLRQVGTSGQGLKGNPLPYSQTITVLPLSLGFKLKLKDNIDLTFESSYRFMKFDYLDDVGNTPYPNGQEINQIVMNYRNGGNYVYRANLPYDPMTLNNRTLYNKAVTVLNGNQSSIREPEINATYDYPISTTKRGSKGNDSYFTTQLSINFYFENNIKKLNSYFNLIKTILKGEYK